MLLVFNFCSDRQMFIINANIVKYSPPPITSVHQTILQIGVRKFLSFSVNEYKNYQPIPYNIHTVWWFE